MSEQIKVRTDNKNTSPPNPVTGLGVIRHREPALTVYWNENKDPDLAQYLVYRSTERTMQNKVLVARIKPTDYFLQLYRDNDLQPGQRYYYKVFVRDWAGLVQTHSKVVWANVVNSK
jgi:hypothetical protein